MNMLPGFTLRLVTSLLAVGALLMAAARPVLAQESFNATHIAQLNGLNETEVVEDDAIGIAVMRLDPQSMTLQYRLTVTRIEGITMAHFHRGPAGADGPIVHTITGISDQNLTVSGTWTMTPSQLDSLIQGMIYINVHTGDHPKGHIRDQVHRIPNAAAPQVTPTQEVPDTIEHRLGAGEAVLWIDQATRVAGYWVHWRDLSGPATAAHFHRGSIGVSGGIIKDLMIQPGDTEALGLWEMTAEEFDLLRAGQVYVNIHTARNPAGEIRGQVFPLDFYTSFISSANEVPSTAGQSSAAGTGFVGVAATPFAAGVAGGNFIVNNTTEEIIAAHIHSERVDNRNGPVFEGLDPDTSLTYWTMGLDDTSVRLTSSDTAALFRASKMYVNFHTGTFPNGEARGQLIPAASNLSTPSSIRQAPMRAEGSALTAWVDGAGIARVRIEDGLSAKGGTVVLYSPIGEQLLRVPVQQDIVEMATAEYAPGVYFAQLIQNGRPAGVCRIVIVH